jgi:hypothetical protein
MPRRKWPVGRNSSANVVNTLEEAAFSPLLGVCILSLS